MSNIRLTYTILQPVTAGQPSVRVSFMLAETLIDGYSDVRSSFFLAESLVDGYSVVRSNLFYVQALTPVQEVPEMVTLTFPGFGNSASNPSIPAALDPFNTPLPGLSIEVIKRPVFNSRIDEASSGREIRTSYTEWPRWEFELSYEFLEDKSGADSSLKTILGFFVDCQGSFVPWRFKDPDDYAVQNGMMGVADGVTTQFYFRRYIGIRGEPVGQVDTANTITVYVDGVEVPDTEYTIEANYIVFNTAPLDGLIVSADFQFYYVCRFLENQMEFQKFAEKLWDLQTCEFKSILT